MILAFIITFCVILLDQTVKNWIVASLDLHQSMPGVARLFDFYHIRNEGASWGMLAGQRWLFILLTLAVVVYIIHLLITHKRERKLFYVAYGLLLGGAVGNLIDRIRLGYVIDMFRLQFMEFPIFNVADVALTLGVVCLLGVLFLEKEKEIR
ncbi:MAG: signal peptidase II [Aerococcaceae bacterium]|nr:signal peptidase II [Aerococcaceae bacterium]